MSKAAGDATAVARPPDAVVDQPRPFGYVIGDLIQQRILLPSTDRGLDLPPAGRVSLWLERRPPRLVSDSQGRRWLVVDYQLINAPQGLTTINLPAWTVAFQSGGEGLRIPQWPLTVGPLTLRSVLAQGGLQELRADRPAPTIATAPLLREVEIGCGAFVLTLLAWGLWAWWRTWRAASRQPFARAIRELRGLDDASPEAWLALHRAFDLTAGRAVQSATLPELFDRIRDLTPLRGRIERFFAQSSELFFGGGLPPEAISVQALCGDLERIERSRE